LSGRVLSGCVLAAACMQPCGCGCVAAGSPAQPPRFLFSLPCSLRRSVRGRLRAASWAGGRCAVRAALVRRRVRWAQDAPSAAIQRGSFGDPGRRALSNPPSPLQVDTPCNVQARQGSCKEPPRGSFPRQALMNTAGGRCIYRPLFLFSSRRLPSRLGRLAARAVPAARSVPAGWGVRAPAAPAASLHLLSLCRLLRARFLRTRRASSYGRRL
jgi:hypothetical protein